MYAALRKLGTLDTKERIRRFVSEQRHQTDQQLDHDYDCICRDCERQQLLGLRKARRSVPKTPKNAMAEDLVPLLHPAEGSCPGRGGLSTEPARQTTFRRRPTNENARRGESKLGRAAHLRPGRITLPLPESIMSTKGKSKAEDGDSQLLLNPAAGASVASFHAEKDREETAADCWKGREVVSRDDGQPCASPIDGSDGESSWKSDEHSLHSNLVHHEAKQMKTTSPTDLAPLEANLTSRTEEDPREEDVRKEDEQFHCPLLDDIFGRNPAAAANGWLAMPHHRDNPDWTGRQDRSQAIKSAVRNLIQPNQPHMLGLVPKLRSSRRSHRR